MKWLRAFIFCLFLLPLVSLLSACGENAGGSGSTPTTPSPTTSSATEASQEVRIVMGEMYFKTPVTTFKVGQSYKLVLLNEGKVPHEFAITPTRKADEDHANLDAHSLLHEDKLGAGQSRTVDFTFKQAAPAGTLEFECSYPGHYGDGMHVAIVVE